ncbi:hypothetical protein KIPB_014910, partial [Kipferlia bialata]
RQFHYQSVYDMDDREPQGHREREDEPIPDDGDMMNEGGLGGREQVPQGYQTVTRRDYISLPQEDDIAEPQAVREAERERDAVPVPIPIPIDADPVPATLLGPEGVVTNTGPIQPPPQQDDDPYTSPYNT